jgi:pimeloyl-ACP methyl ester carboxylesterase
MSDSDFDAGAVRGAIVREALSLLAHGLLLPFGRVATGARPLRSRDLRTVVFLHGLAANRSGFLPMRGYLRALGYDRQYAFNYRSSGSLEKLAVAFKRELDDRVQGGRIDLIAHSMGGLVARAYVQQLGGERRVDRLITLGTPHRGTHAANFIPAGLVRQLLPGSRFLARLNALPPPQRVRMTSVVAGRDVLVQPIESAHCPFGETIVLDDLGHVELLFRPEVYRLVAAELARPVAVAMADVAPEC